MENYLPFISQFKEEFRKQKIHFIYYRKDHFREKRGSSESRNIGFKMASQPIVFILDDDIILNNDFLEILSSYRIVGIAIMLFFCY
ncbi:glycosyltransferase [bacterium]|nr:glycosyltransferase [bacterium]